MTYLWPISVAEEYEEEEVEELETPTAHLETRPQEHSRRNLLRRKHEGEKEEEEETEEETEEEEEEELETPTARRETRPQVHSRRIILLFLYASEHTAFLKCKF